MKNKLTILLLLLGISAFSQSNFDQYSLEADYGFNHTRNPKMTEFRHFGFGFRYMFNEYWGIKFDYGTDSFESETTPDVGAKYSRFSAQGVYNLGRAINLKRVAGNSVGLLLHTGMGISVLDSDAAKKTDKIGNVIIGITPQVRITDFLTLRTDLSGILNFSQQQKFDGNKVKGGFTGKMLTASIGLTYYFGRNKSTSDWR